MAHPPAQRLWLLCALLFLQHLALVHAGPHATLGRPLFTGQCRASLQAFLAKQAVKAGANNASCYGALDALLSSETLLQACTDGGMCLRPDLVSMGGLWGRMPTDVQQEQGALAPIEQPMKDALGLDDGGSDTGQKGTKEPLQTGESDATFLPRQSGKGRLRTLQASEAFRVGGPADFHHKKTVHNASVHRQLALVAVMPHPPASACPLCVLPGTAEARMPCRRDIGAFLALAQEQGHLLATSVTPAADETRAEALSARACAHPAQLASLALLRDQPEVVCNRLTRALPFTAGTYSGASLTQCSACAVMACLPGMMCASNSPPVMCGPGLQCPGGLAAIQPPDIGGVEAKSSARRLQDAAKPDVGDVEETAVRRDNLLVASTYRCPAGMACAGGGTDPYSCPFGSWCPEGSSRPVYFLPIAVTSAAVAVVLLSCRARSVQEIRRGEKGGRVWACLRPRYGANAACCCRPVDLQEREAEAIPAHALYQDWRIVFRFSGLVLKGSSDRSPQPARVVTDHAATTAPMDTQQYRLNGVSGVLRPGRLTAVLGGSGAGKTTLLRTLLGHEKLNAGQVTIGITTRRHAGGGNEGGHLPYLHTYTQPQKLLQWAVGLVPQHDLLSAELTVREAVEHSSQTRLPSSTPTTEVQQHVERVLQDLDLLHVADRRIGDVRSRGISGGERKRVCIAVELARDPLVLMLDEPTSGLDASAAVSLLAVLQRTSRQRCIPVLVVIHSPRTEAWALIDDVILLASGGCTAYAGAREGMVPCLARVVRTPPPGFNPANWALDVLQGSWLQKQPMEGLAVPSNYATDQQPVLCAQDGVMPAGSEHKKLAPMAAGASTNSHCSTEMQSAAGVAIATLPLSTSEPTVSSPVLPSSALALERHIPAQRRSTVAAGIVSAIVDGWRVEEEQGRGMGATVVEVKELSLHSPVASSSSSGSAGGTGVLVDGEALLRRLRTSRTPPGFWYQCARHMSRAAKLRYRGPSVLVDICSMSFAGLIVGVASVGGPLFLPSVPMIYWDSCPFAARSLCVWAQRWMIGPGAFYVSIVAGSMAIPPAVRIFGAETAMGRRAVALGALNVPAYFCAKLLTDSPMPLLLSACFTALLTLLGPWRAPWYTLWLAVCSEMVAAGAVGVLLSVLLPSTDSANLTGVILAGLTLNIFGGFVPVVGTGAYWAYTRYVQRALAAAEVIEGYGLPEEQYSYFVPAQWAPPAFWLDIACLWAIAGTLLLIALPILRVTLNRVKL